MKTTLTNSLLSVTIDTFGAEMHSIQKDKLEYLWQADPSFWGRHAPVLFPIVGKLKNGEYRYHDQTYKMGGHGFARDSEFQLIQQTANTLIYELTENSETLAKYPFRFKFDVTYQLIDNQISVSYTVKNTNNCPLYFSVGAHPAFNVPIEKGNFENYALTIKPIEERTFIPLNPAEGTLETSEKETVADYKKHLTRTLFEKDALVYSSSEKMEVSLTNNLDERSVKLSWEKMPYFGLWSPYPEEAPFVCIEPWCGVADSEEATGELSAKLGINKLEAHEDFSCCYTIEIN